MTDRWSLDGRVAIVAGAGRGLGLGCARALAEAGARVLLVSRTEAEIDRGRERSWGARRTSPTSPTPRRCRESSTRRQSWATPASS